jgi:hemolysin-activating ACP:hemolysin acyltransferase
VNKITDASGNAIDYVYSEDHVNGEYTLSRISEGILLGQYKLIRNNKDMPLAFAVWAK